MKVVKFEEEKMLNAEKKKARSQQRDKKVTWADIEDPQEKEFEEGFIQWKQSQKPKVVHQPERVERPELVKIPEELVEDMPHIEDWESDGDDWFD